MSQDPETKPEGEPDQPLEPKENGDHEIDLSSDQGYIDFEDDSEPVIDKPLRIKDLLTSPDRPSKIMTALSMGFGLMSLLCIALLTYVIITHRHAKKPVALDADIQKMYLEPSAQENLGNYQVVLKAEPGQPHDFDLRVDIVAQCSTKEACATLKEKNIEARDVINPVLSSITRDEFLTLQGKNRVRRRIAEQLSGMVKNGKIEEVHFTDLTIESGR